MRRITVAIMAMALFGFASIADCWSASEATDTVKVQKQLAALVKELGQLNKTPQFHQMGFGAGYPKAHAWLQKVQNLDKNSGKAAFQVKVGPGYLIQFGKELMRDPTCASQVCKDMGKFVDEAINWKPEN